jgi:kelch-like protein 10
MDLLVPRAYHGIVSINRLIYVIGGFDGMDYFNSCRVFDSETFQWREIAPMNVKRCYVSVAILDGLIYAMVIFRNGFFVKRIKEF